jgi:GNAT superfamily N-acetyltransferase
MYVREVEADELDFVAQVCLDPSVRAEWKQIMNPYMAKRKEWLKKMMKKGLGIAVAFQEVRGKESPKALIEYVPIEFAAEPVEGGNSLFINCIWVVPPLWHQGVAKTLLERTIEKAKAYGGISVLAYEGDKWFGFFPYMPVSFFKKFGFKEVDRDDTRVLLYLNLGSAETPKLIHPKCKPAIKGGKLMVDVFTNSQCPWSGLMIERMKKNIAKFGAAVNIIDTDYRKTLKKHGMSRGVCINGVPVLKRMASWKEIETAVKAYKR